MARFPDGTLVRVKAVLRDGENQADFIREAVELELPQTRGAAGRRPRSRLVAVLRTLGENREAVGD